MAQQLPADSPIDPVTTSGTELAEILNRFVDAVNTSNSGATAPPETFGGMLWANTAASPAVLQIRNAGNTAWERIPISAPAGSPWLLPDGTVTAPGLAWASEPGLGWWRAGTNQLGFATAGQTVISLDNSLNTSFRMALSPRAGGDATLALFNNSSSAANKSAFVITVRADNNVVLATAAVGTNSVGAMLFEARGLYRFANDPGGAGGNTDIQLDSGANANFVLNKLSGSGFSNALYGKTNGVSRWVVTLGEASAETGALAGSDFTIQRADDAGTLIERSFVISRANGVTTLTRQLAVLAGGADITGDSVVRGRLTTTADVLASRGLIWDGASAPAGMTSVNYVAGAQRSIRIWDGSSVGDTGYCQVVHTPAVETRVRHVVGGGNAIFDMKNSGQGESVGGWVTSCDLRFKENLQVIEGAMAMVRSWTGYTFDKTNMLNKDGEPLRKAGLIAQDVHSTLPEAVTVSPDEMGTLFLDDQGPIAVLTNALKELDARLAQLETA